MKFAVVPLRVPPTPTLFFAVAGEPTVWNPPLFPFEKHAVVGMVPHELVDLLRAQVVGPHHRATPRVRRDAGGAAGVARVRRLIEIVEIGGRRD
jgi:hypothetical protein